VVAVHAVFDPPDGLPYLVMECLEGPTFAELIHRAAGLPPDEAAGLVAQVAEGLVAAHAAGVVHRDIKPGNILVDRVTGRAKVMDFGLARRLVDGSASPTGLTHEGVLAGTPAYMSPEQVRGSEAIDPRTDVYSLGVSLYEALTGEVPFRGAAHLVLQQIVADEPRAPRQLNDAIPRDLETICLKALAKEPGRRYQSAREFADDLRRFERREPVRARPVGPLARGRRWCRRKPLVAGLLVALAVAVGGGLAGIAFQWRRAETKAREALASQQRAQHDFARARAAVDRYLNLVTENPDLKAHNFEPLRRDLLIAAREFYEEFVREHPGDPNVQTELGKAYGRLGQIVSILQSRPDAIGHFRKMQAIFERLHAIRPHDAGCAFELAESCQRLGEARRFMHEYEPAERELRRAIELLAPLIDTGRNHPEYSRQLMEAHYRLGDLMILTGRLPEANQTFADGRAVYARWIAHDPPTPEQQASLGYLAYGQARDLGLLRQPEAQQEAFREAATIFERLAGSQPEVDSHRATLGTVLNEIGIMHARARQADRAEAAWRRVIAINQQLLRAHPANVTYQSLLADVGINLGTLALFVQNRPEVALAELRAGCAAYERLAHDYPRMKYYGSNLRNGFASLEATCKHLGRLDEALKTDERALAQLGGEFAEEPTPESRALHLFWLGCRADTFRRLERFDEALRDCDRARDLADEPERPAIRVWRTLVEACAAFHDGDTSGAVQLAEAVASASADDGLKLTAVAALCARAAARIRHESARGDSQADRYAARAIEHLDAAAKAGGLTYEFQRRAINDHVDFAILKSRPELMRLLSNASQRP
jgi:serine/threonine-protein kinase